MLVKIRQKVHSYTANEHFNEILRGMLYSFGSKVLVKLIGIVTSIIAARYYGAEMIGLMALLMSVQNIAGLFATFGLSNAMMRLIPEYAVKYSQATSIALYKKIRNLAIMTTLSVSVLLYFLSGVIADKVYKTPELAFFIILAALVLVFGSLNAVYTTMLRTMKKIKLYALLELLPKIISAVMLLILTFAFYDKFNLMYVALFPPVFMSLWLIFYMHSVTAAECEASVQENLPRYKEILSIAWPMWMTRGMNIIIGQTDVIMIGIFASVGEVGVYGVVLSLVSLIGFVLSSVNVMMAPKISELYHSKKPDELAEIVQRTSKLMFWVALPIILFLLLSGKYLLAIFGTEFEAGYTVLVILALGQFINAASGSVGNVLNMVGYQKQFRNIVFFTAVMNICFNYVLLPKYGMEGAAIASFISMTFLNLVSVGFVKKKLGFYTLYFPGVKKYEA